MILENGRKVSEDNMAKLYLRESVDTSIDEAKKKKKKGALVNPDAGNVEHNVEMFNKMNSPVDGPCNNPVSGPFGGDVGCAESLAEELESQYEFILPYAGEEDANTQWLAARHYNLRYDEFSENGGYIRLMGSKEDLQNYCDDYGQDSDSIKLVEQQLEEGRNNPYFTPYGYRDAAKVLNKTAPEYYWHLKEIEMDTGDGRKLARYALRKGLPVMVDPDDDPDYPTFYLDDGSNKYHWDDYFYPYASSYYPDNLVPYDGKMFNESLDEDLSEDLNLDDYVETNEITREQADIASNIDFRINEEDVILFIQADVIDLTTVKIVRYTTTKDSSYDGGYQVILKDGSKKEFGWKDSDRVVKLYPLNEALPPKKETIELEYKDLEFTQCGPQRDVDDWDEWDRCMDWTYEVDKDDLYTFIFESCIDETDFAPAFDDNFDPNKEEDWQTFVNWLDDNFETIYAKYEQKILDNWEEDAAEEAAEDYDPDDYVDWDSMPGGHDYYESLNEGYVRSPKMIDYFEQMNKEDDEA